jgi:hypothetical protein
VTALCDNADQLLELIPEESPPAGFELRVLDAVATNRPRHHHRSALAAALVLAIALFGGGWLIGASPTTPSNDDDSRPGTRAVLYTPLTDSTGQRIGQAYLYSDQPAWMYVSVNATRPNSTISCSVLHRDGTSTVLGTFQIVQGQAAWQFTETMAADTIVGATVADPQGQIISKAQFPPTHPDDG